MAGDAGTLEVKMVMGLARLQQDVTQAKDIVGRGMAGIESAVRVASVALGALGATLSVGFFANLVKGSIDAMDHLNDLSKSTSLAVETLAGLKLAARQTGSDLDGTAAAINKLSVNIGQNTEKFAKLGITAKDPLEAFKQLADVTNALQDPQQRAAVLAEALGKSWQQAAPLLAEGGQKIGEMVEKGAKLSGITTEMAHQADELNDKWAELTGNGGLLNSVVGASLPLMNKLVDDLVQVKEKGEGASTFAEHFRTVLGFLVTQVGEVIYVLKGMGIELGGIAAQAVALLGAQFQLMTGNVGGAIKEFQRFGTISDQMKSDAEANRKAHEEWKSSIAAVGVTAGLAAKQVKGMSEEDLEAGRIAADAAKAFLAKAEAVKKSAKATDEAREAARRARLEWDDELESLKDQLKAFKDQHDALEKMEKLFEKNAEHFGHEAAVEMADAAGEMVESGMKVHDQWLTTWTQIGDAAGNFFSDLVMNGRSAFDNLRTSLKQLLADMIALFAKRWILQLVGSGTAGDVGANTLAGSALSGVSSWFSGGTSIGSSVLGAAGNFQAGWAAAGQGIQLANGAPAMQQFGAAVRGATGALGIFSAVAAGMLLNNSYFSAGWRADNQSSSLRNFDRIFAAPGLGLSGDAFWRRLGLSDRMASLLSGSSLHSRIWGVGPVHSDAYGVSGTVGPSGVSAQNWQDWSQRGGLFHGDVRGTDVAGLSDEQSKFWQSFMQGISGVTGPLAQALGQSLSSVLGSYSHSFNMQLSDNGDPLSDEKINALFNQLFTDVLREQVTTLFDAAGESEIADYIRGLTGDVDEIKAQVLEVVNVFHGLQVLGQELTGLDFTSLQAFQQEGESIGQTLDRIAGAWYQIEDAFTSSETKLHNAQAAISDLFADMTAAGLTLPTTREGWLDVMRSLDLSTEAGRSFFNRMMALAPAFDLSTSAVDRMKAELDGLAHMRFLHGGGTEQAFLIQQLLAHNPLLAAGTAGMSIEDFVNNLWTISDADYARYSEIDRRIIDSILGADLHNTTAIAGLGESLGSASNNFSGDITNPNVRPGPTWEWNGRQWVNTGPSAGAGTAGNGLAGYLQGLLTGSTSPLDPRQQLDTARKEYERVLGLAQGGDQAAISGLQGAHQTYINLARQMFGSSSDFVEIFTRTFNEVAGVAGVADYNTRMLDNSTKMLEHSVSSVQYQAQMADSLLEVRNTLREIADRPATNTTAQWDPR